MLSQLGGFPLRIRWSEGEVITSETRFESVKRVSVAKAMFELPADYQRRLPTELLGPAPLGPAAASPAAPQSSGEVSPGGESSQGASAGGPERAPY